MTAGEWDQQVLLIKWLDTRRNCFATDPYNDFLNNLAHAIRSWWYEEV